MTVTDGYSVIIDRFVFLVLTSTSKSGSVYPPVHPLRRFIFGGITCFWASCGQYWLLLPYSFEFPSAIDILASRSRQFHYTPPHVSIATLKRLAEASRNQIFILIWFSLQFLSLPIQLYPSFILPPILISANCALLTSFQMRQLFAVVSYGNGHQCHISHSWDQSVLPPIHPELQSPHSSKVA